MTDETSEDAPRAAFQSQSTENPSARALLRILENARVVPPEPMAASTASAPSGDIEAPGAVPPRDDQAAANPTSDGDAEAPQPDTHPTLPKEEVPPTDPIPVGDDNTDADLAGDDYTDADPVDDYSTDADSVDNDNTDAPQPDANPTLPKEEVPPTDSSSKGAILLRPELEIKDDKQNESKPAWRRNRLFYGLCLGCLVTVVIVVTVTTHLLMSGRNSQQDGSTGCSQPKGGATPGTTPNPVSSQSTSLLLLFDFDQHASETSWTIADACGTTVATRSSRTYFRGQDFVAEPVRLNMDTVYTLTVIDSAGDGLCCRYGNGQFFLYLGDTPNRSRALIYDDGSFGFSVMYTFTVSDSAFLPVSEVPEFTLLNPIAQVGSDFTGSSLSDSFGYSVALSADGTVLAIGAEGDGSTTGFVQVHTWQNNRWVQRGSTILGRSTGRYFGSAVALSADGTILAVGGFDYVRILSWTGSQWIPLGADIEAEGSGDCFGCYLAMSSDGTTVAVGAFRNDGPNGVDAGHVRVFERAGSSSSTSWVQRGVDLDGDSPNDWFGRYVSLSADGSILAVGSMQQDPDGVNNAGHIRVFRWIDGEWVPIRAVNVGRLPNMPVGNSLWLSDDGQVLAIGAPGATEAGVFVVFEYTGSTWVQKGQTVFGDASGDVFGHAVALSGDGNVLICSAPRNDKNGVSSGMVRVYKYDSGSWVQIGGDLLGGVSSGQFGWSVAVSDDGSRVAVGSSGGAGLVEVFQLPE